MAAASAEDGGREVVKSDARVSKVDAVEGDAAAMADVDDECSGCCDSAAVAIVLHPNLDGRWR